MSLITILLLTLPFLFLTVAPATDLDVYIVHVTKPADHGEASTQQLHTWYHSFVPESIRHEDRIIHKYLHVASGFAARLTGAEVDAMSLKPGFLSAEKQRILSLHTTHTPKFLGLHRRLGFLKGSNFGKGVIIGVLDTGVLPTHPSFDDAGMDPPPSKWRGWCEFGDGVCNKKLIGARSFLTHTASSGAGGGPYDEEGHGTHTASTAAGGFVRGASALGNAGGTAVGMAPSAHLAVYKVCGDIGCAEADVLAGIDAAVGDGVDVLSISLGGGSLPFYRDTTAIGAFAAVRKGVFVSCSAGNNGPHHRTLSNEAPWILTVGASTLDRKIRAAARLGNGKNYEGESLYQPKNEKHKLLPLVYAGRNGDNSSAQCSFGALDRRYVRGKVVVCDRGGGIARIDKGKEVKRAGGAAMILANDAISGYTTIADAHVLPAAHVDYKSGLAIKSYIKSTRKPTAGVFFHGTAMGDKSAPSVAAFSSRGPSVASPGVFKPDVIGPGVSVIAAWPYALENATTGSGSRKTFNVLSGTSMSCPHLSGIAALLKSSHPDWSPAAVKSAIMTTADAHNLGGHEITDQTLRHADAFATGAGHVNPTKANDPGLVYDTSPEEYVPYLCGLGYPSRYVSVLVQRAVDCGSVDTISEAQLNYPAFCVYLGGRGGAQTYTRTVTNVGPAASYYTVDVSAPQGVDVSVSPGEIWFDDPGQKATYTVTFVAARVQNKARRSRGFLRWVSDKHSVYSPIVAVFRT